MLHKRVFDMQRLGAVRSSEFKIELSQKKFIHFTQMLLILGTLMKSMTPCLLAYIYHNRDLNQKPSFYETTLKGVVNQFI